MVKTHPVSTNVLDRACAGNIRLLLSSLFTGLRQSSAGWLPRSWAEGFHPNAVSMSNSAVLKRLICNRGQERRSPEGKQILLDIRLIFAYNKRPILSRRVLLNNQED
jgi:hypothetical protein